MSSSQTAGDAGRRCQRRLHELGLLRLHALLGRHQAERSHGAAAAGIVLGARVPVILTSRADSVAARLASCAVAVLMAQRQLQDARVAGR